MCKIINIDLINGLISEIITYQQFSYSSLISSSSSLDKQSYELS